MPNSKIKINPSVGKCAAYADIDGTLSDTNIVQPLLWFNIKCLPFPQNIFRTLKILALCPYWVLLDKTSREKSNISIYRQYRGISISDFKRLATGYYQNVFKPKIYPEALETIKEFQKNGYTIVLVTGGVSELVHPFANELGAESFAITLETKDGKFTGNIVDKPLTGKAKSEIIKSHSEKHGVNLKYSYALGDAYGDLEMLECVGNPVAVNPDKRLLEIAKKRGWQIAFWK